MTAPFRLRRAGTAARSGEEARITHHPAETYTIADLVGLTGVPPATVHYYLRHGLLPQPKHLAPNRFAYDQRHVQALRLIRMLRDQRGLPLPMIRRILPELLRLHAEEAFSPEMWDRALAPRISRRPTPSARLLEVAKEAFARRGYDEVNVDDLCRAARIAKGSFYRHYRSKEELFLAAAESSAEEVASGFRRAVPEEAGAGTAAKVLATILEPRLPLVLELLARAVQGRLGHRATARRILGRVAGEVGRTVGGESQLEERGMAVIGAAVMQILGGVLKAPELEQASHEVPQAVGEGPALEVVPGPG